MPVVLFTIHTYGSWLPDRSEGFVLRGKGVQATDQDLADRYRRRMSGDAVAWDSSQQHKVIATLVEWSAKTGCRLFAASAVSTHVHAVVGWKEERSADSIRRSIKHNLSRELNRAFGNRRWLSRKGSNQRVKDAEHLQHLRGAYLPAHQGWRYDDDTGIIAPE